MSGPRQHFLPAAVIGRFAPGQDSTPARDRKIWVLRRNGTITRQSAATVAYQNNLYDAGDVLLSAVGRGGKLVAVPLDIDGYWATSEERANPATDALLANTPGPYSAQRWIHLAEYIASIFARSPDFPAEHNRRLDHTPGGPLDEFLTKENVNAVRILENLRVSAAVARARWTILLSPSHPLIMNDRGATALYHIHNDSYGYAIPLRPHLAVALERGPWDKPIIWTGDEWHIDIPTYTLSPAQAQNLNEATWPQCRREIYASHEAELQRLRRHTPAPPLNTIPADTFDYARLLGLSPSERRDSENLLQHLSAWHPTPTRPG